MMITAGTMEAFTDFQTTGAATKTSITTYLEGEIIDFKTHSLQTFNFPSSIKDDASNWRKLEPFCQLSNEELVKSLVSKQFMKNLTDNWVFMRWKGEIFETLGLMLIVISVLLFFFPYLSYIKQHLSRFYMAELTIHGVATCRKMFHLATNLS
jgi:hypothetical protein